MPELLIDRHLETNIGLPQLKVRIKTETDRFEGLVNSSKYDYTTIREAWSIVRELSGLMRVENEGIPLSMAYADPMIAGAAMAYVKQIPIERAMAISAATKLDLLTTGNGRQVGIWDGFALKSRKKFGIFHMQMVNTILVIGHV